METEAAAQERKQAVTRQEESKAQARRSGIGRFCGACGAPTVVGADLCEPCGTWLLTGQCVFCYAAVRPDQVHCGECGNPPRGVSCPICGQSSHFDFCPHCVTPLTEAAKAEIELLKTAPAMQVLLASATLVEHEVVGDTPGVLLAQEREEATHKTERRSLSELVEAAECARASDAAAARAQSDREQAAIRSLQQESFATNQQARRYFGALKVLLPARGPRPTAWICNAFGAVHPAPAGPADCACPEKGGRWVVQNGGLEEVEL